VLPDLEVLLDGQRLVVHVELEQRARLFFRAAVLLADHAKMNARRFFVDRCQARDDHGLEHPRVHQPVEAEAPVLGLDVEVVADAHRGHVLARPDRPLEHAAVELVAAVLRRVHQVHVVEVRPVDGVLHDVLGMRAHVPGILLVAARPVVGAEVGDHRDLEVGSLALGVVPDEHEAVALEHGVGAGLGLGGDLVGVGDVLAGALGVELPAVEGAGDAVALHLAAVAEMGADVGAEGLERADLSILAAEQHDVAAEEVDGFHLSPGQLVGIADVEPAVGGAERESGHGGVLRTEVGPYRTCSRARARAVPRG
jgi:hypothetical protein